MFYYLSQILADHFHVLHVFQYLTVRSILAALTALFISLLLGPTVIRKLAQYQIGQVVRDDGPQSHFSKAGTPTMGGSFVLIAIGVSTLLWADLANVKVWLVLIVTMGCGLIGFIDDYRKLIRKNSRGLPAKWKFFWQAVLGLGAAGFLYFTATGPMGTSLLIPLFKDLSFNLGIFYILLVFLVIVGSSNAVNLTDGLDGLAILPIVLVAGGLGVFAYLSGNIEFSKYLYIPYIEGTGEIAVFCSAIVGAGLGFLWYNSYPAQVFMGDVGSLGLGAALGMVAVIVHQEIVLLIMGGIFVIETLSVILQVGSFKLRGKRIFRMAPIHHHFELKGWTEPKVIVRFWIITVILVLVGLATIKLR